MIRYLKLRQLFHTNQHVCLYRFYGGMFKILPMPILGPAMQYGKLIKWHVKPGDLVPTYGLIADIVADSMTIVDGEQSEVEIELQEEMYLVKCFCLEGDTLKAGEPLALLCEEESDFNEVSDLDLTFLLLDNLQVSLHFI